MSKSATRVSLHELAPFVFAMKKIDHTGKRFGRLLVLGKVPGLGSLWNCLCDCGVNAVSRAGALVRGARTSCGCLHMEKLTKHRMCFTPTYSSWTAMLKRCYNKNHQAYSKYGGAGVTVTERWHTFTEFYADVGERPDGTTLDRFPNQRGNYEPGNVRWATCKQQNRNRTNTSMLTFNGETLPIFEWSEIKNIRYGTLLQRLNHSRMSIEEALNTPTRHYAANRN